MRGGAASCGMPPQKDQADLPCGWSALKLVEAAGFLPLKERTLLF